GAGLVQQPGGGGDVLPNVATARVHLTDRDPHGDGAYRPTASRTASRDLGSSRLERSPGSSPSAAARIARRTIFALRVLGSSRTNTIRAGAKDFPRWSATTRRSSSASPGSFGLSTTKHHTCSPFIGSGTPTAADSATEGCDEIADSTSAGPIRLPAMLRVSSERPRRNQKPSSSRTAQSPCTQTPGHRDQ